MNPELHGLHQTMTCCSGAHIDVRGYPGSSEASFRVQVYAAGVTFPPGVSGAGLLSSRIGPKTLLALSHAARTSGWLAKRIWTSPFMTFTTWTSSSETV